MKRLLADSSFYICFLDDINCPDELIIILSNFDANLCQQIHTEVSKSKNFCKINNQKLIKKYTPSPFQLGNLIKPFFSKDETLKGEHELIVLAYVTYNIDNNFVLVMDESGPRNFVTTQFPYLKDNMTGTVGMIGECYYTYKLFSKQQSLNLLESIKDSDFWVEQSIIQKVKEKIEKQ